MQLTKIVNRMSHWI